MPSIEQLRSRLLKKLSELFQLDQPDLDFGFYRIMHAKSAEVQDFIDTDLLKIVADAFGDVDEARKAELQAAYEKAIQTAKDFGAPNPEETEPVKKAKAALDALKDTASAEADVYDHLYRFFERYYDDGDFISRRYYTRETSGKAAPFAVPYNGEEVKLHWANADQYYIKSAEYFSNFTFDLIQSAEVRKMSKEERILNKIPEHPLKVHFKVVEATEGEHGNVKATDANKRFFILHAESPVALTETGELVINFEYRPDPEKTGQENTWRDKRNAEAVETILKTLEGMINHEKHETDESKTIRGRLGDYLRLLKSPAPTETDKKRPVLAKYVNQYTARNTMDYFIHKDLGGFLRRELDFYIKNEVMRLDDIENAEAPAVESYLAKIKVLRRIAGKLVDFLAQLEDFQKKLWLKKKFVVETNYCITLDRIPEELYADVAACDAQCEEWIRLFAIDEIQADLHSPGFSRPLTVEFLKANNKLVLDTRFFDDSFKTRLIASIENFDEQCDGLLIHSENFQALNLLQERYREQVKCVYIDPPYNTSASEIIYKNSYKNSSWMTFLEDRIAASQVLMSSQSIICATIDDFEFHRLRLLIDRLFSKECFLGVAAIKNNPSGRSTAKGFSIAHEYGIFASKSEGTTIGRLLHSEQQLSRYKFKDTIGAYEWVNFRKHGGANANRRARPKLYYPIFISESAVRFPQIEWIEKKNSWELLESPTADEKIIYPVAPNGDEKTWKWGVETARANPEEFCVRKDQTGELGVYRKARINEEGTLPLTVWDKKEYSSTEYGTNLLKRIFGESEMFSFPKSVYAVMDSVRVSNANVQSLILDFFAGSGTTGHAVINLNREDTGTRKYILAEMGDYFDKVLKPRIAKVVYSESWKDGKPIDRHTGISHCFKYIRLESYEDTLNNLRLDHNPKRKKAVAANPALKEDYMLRYLLDVETRGSQSLLNIDAFADPTRYTLEVKKPGTDAYATRAVDLIETFNYLIGLRVEHYAAPQEFVAKFKRIEDPEVPTNQKTKLVIDGRLQQIRNHGFTQIDTDKEESNPCSSVSIGGSKTWWFRKLEGWVPADPANPNNGQREKVLIVWRKLTDDIEQDNLMLDEWFEKNRINPRDFEFDTIYVNGSNNLPNLKREDEHWKVRLIEEEFMQRMWEAK